tara:strand:- start:1224 stop:1415 length:192 start_codon:yes stop_codon:yes gene_type:complete
MTTKKVKHYLIERHCEDGSLLYVKYRKLYKLVQRAREEEESQWGDPFRILKVYEDDTCEEIYL